MRSRDKGLQGRRSRTTGGLQQAATELESLPISAVLCVGPQDARLVDAVRARLPGPSELVVVRNRHELHEAERDLAVASFFALGTGTGAGVDALRVLSEVAAAWPSVPRIWFDRYSRPALPPKPGPELVGVRLWEASYFDSPGRLASHLAAACERGNSERVAQVASARAFAARYRLPDVATRLCTAVALRVPEARWTAFVGYDDPRQLTRYLHRCVYDRVGVRSRADLVRQVMDFQQRWLLSNGPGVEESGGRGDAGRWSSGRALAQGA